MGKGPKVLEASHRYLIQGPNPPEMVQNILFISAFFWGGGTPTPSPLSHTQLRTIHTGVMFFFHTVSAGASKMVHVPPCMHALGAGAHGCQPSSLPWSQAPQAIRGSLKVLEIQGGLSPLQDLVAQQVPWSHSCQARQACQLFPSLLHGPSVLKVQDHPARTGSHSPALPGTVKSPS